MTGRASQYRKSANHGADGGLGELDTGQGPINTLEPGPEALAVLARMSALDPQEERAITNFVNSCVDHGIWTKIVDFWCPALNATDFLTSFKGVETLTIVGTADQQPGVGMEFQTTGYALTGRTMDLICPQVYSAAGAFVLKFFLEDDDNTSRYWAARDGVNSAGFWWEGADTRDFRIAWGNEEIDIVPCFQRPVLDTLITGNDGAGLDYVLFPGDFLRTAAHTFVAMPIEQFAFNGFYNQGVIQEGRHVTQSAWFFTLNMDRDDLTAMRDATNRLMYDLRVIPNVPPTQ